MGGRYIYGIAPASDDTHFDISGLGGSGAVYTIAHQGVGCAVSDYSGAELGSMPREEVVRQLLAHQVVVEHIMRELAVLPVKFGTILAGSEEVRDLLSQGHRQFLEALAWIEDKVQIEVAATWDTGRVLREISTEPEIVRTREAIASRPGQTLEDSIRLGQMAKAFMDQRRARYCESMVGFLSPLAVDVQPNALLSDVMVMNVAFLVERGRQEEFDLQVGQLNDRFHDQVNFRIVGPLPPYSFATVEVKKPIPERIAAARQLLRLGQVISEPQVRKAYRRLAAGSHPDLSPAEGGASERLARLREASEVLLAYCRGSAGREDAQGNCSITREAVERTLLITVRRLVSEEVEPARFGGMAGLSGREGSYDR
ncbi:MAG: GvpL/GvpF family gas vesicle protein [Chloroflexi bacterium]|nr:GvpL/GvpF family gas vesicle protein [Chloroflexota bacterium]